MDIEQKQAIQKEYERLKALFEKADDVQMALADGLLQEAATIKVQMDMLNEVASRTGLVKIDAKNPARQKELPVSKVLAKQRANYVAYIQRIRSLLDVEDNEDDDGLADYE
ncbi:putative phage protein [Selenomonas ruminantium subsp. lactilytica TAM6421]|uniref:Putative phage protein n=1 Tax=Selenomonas ruminantium subsp. lactilytica (strain NBRC 103574 / TAM6421) TaxID=927704 RepID=I0GRZ4_SELRL|nr:hypothetical protein [Selenomonas ruminantium]BAL83531.1 putative phage protein [Selenomonas ruminantium subsp. lactilytica TAM6421]